METGYGGRFRFECQRCGECCRNPGQLTDYEFARIADRLGMPRPQFYRDMCEMFDNGIALRPRRDPETGYCTFLAKSKTKALCGIYDDRPSNCSLAPLALNPVGGVLFGKCPAWGGGAKGTGSETT